MSELKVSMLYSLPIMIRRIIFIALLLLFALPKTIMLVRNVVTHDIEYYESENSEESDELDGKESKEISKKDFIEKFNVSSFAKLNFQLSGIISNRLYYYNELFLEQHVIEVPVPPPNC